MDINRRAPIVLKHQIDIFAPPEKVWDRLSRVDLWRTWHPDISSSYWVDETGPSAQAFKWRVQLFSVTSFIEACHAPVEIGWTGRSWLASGRHVFRIDGDYKSTVVTSEASVEGIPVSLLRPFLHRLLDRFGQTWLAALKTKIEAEGQSGGSSNGQNGRRPRSRSNAPIWDYQRWPR